MRDARRLPVTGQDVVRRPSTTHADIQIESKDSVDIPGADRCRSARRADELDTEILSVFRESHPHARSFADVAVERRGRGTRQNYQAHAAR